MRSLLLIATTGIMLLVVSCAQKKEAAGGMTEKAKNNLAAMKGIIQCFEKKDFSKLGDYVADDCVDHYFDKDLKGLAEMKAEYEKWVGMSENSPIRSKVEFANDEYVIVWINFQETMKVDGMGMKKGQTMEKADIEIARFRDGKAVEHWTFIEPAVMMKMMGMSQQATDSIK